MGGAVSRASLVPTRPVRGALGQVGKGDSCRSRPVPRRASTSGTPEAWSTPPHLLGRVFGTLTALSMVGISIGSGVIGVVTSNVGLVATLLCMAAVYLAVGVLMALNPALRAMGTRPRDSVREVTGGR